MQYRQIYFDETGQGQDMGKTDSQMAKHQAAGRPYPCHPDGKLLFSANVRSDAGAFSKTIRVRKVDVWQ